MARRAPLDEKPFRPLDAMILNSVMSHLPEARGGTVTLLTVPEPAQKVAAFPELSARIRPSQEPLAPRTASPTPVVQRLDQEKRILYTREETHAIERLVNNLAVRLSAQVKVSHVIRALTSLLLNAESQIDKRAGELGPLTRPPNGDFAALQRFEREIAWVLVTAMRDAGLPR